MVCIIVKTQETMVLNLFFLINYLELALNTKVDETINNNVFNIIFNYKYILQLMNKPRDWNIVDDELNRKLK